MTKIRIILADDHALLLDAFQALLEPEYEVVCTVTDGQALLESALQFKPDLIILDIAMPQLDGLEAARQIKQLMPRVKLVFLTMNGDPEIAAEAFRAGAFGYLLKTAAASELLEAIRDVLRGEKYVTPAIARGVLGSVFHQPQPKKSSHELTKRQREVVQLLSQGRSVNEIALLLNVTPRTIAYHKYRTMEQLNLKSFAELVQFAVREGILIHDRSGPSPPQVLINHTSEN